MRLRKNLKITNADSKKEVASNKNNSNTPTHRTLMAIAIITITMEVLSRIRITILETPALITVNLANLLNLQNQ